MKFRAIYPKNLEHGPADSRSIETVDLLIPSSPQVARNVISLARVCQFIGTSRLIMVTPQRFTETRISSHKVSFRRSIWPRIVRRYLCISRLQRYVKCQCTVSPRRACARDRSHPCGPKLLQGNGSALAKRVIFDILGLRWCVRPNTPIKICKWAWLPRMGVVRP